MAVTGIEEVVVAARGVAESSSVHRTITKSDLLEMPVVPSSEAGAQGVLRVGLFHVQGTYFKDKV